MTRILTWLLASLLLAGMASAAPWLKSCRSGSETTGLSPGEYACAFPTTNADDTTILSAGNCENVDCQLFDDFDGDATACTVAWTLQQCPSANGTMSATVEDAACASSSNVLGAGDDAEVNLAAQFLRFIGDGAGAEATSCKILCKCALRAN